MASAAADFVPFHMSSDAIPERHRVAMWREEIGRRMLRLDIEPLSEVPFQVDMSIRRLAGMRVLSGFVSHSRWERTREIVASGDDHFGMAVNLNGSAVFSQRGREIELAAGDAVTISHIEPATLVYPGGQQMGILVQRAALAPFVGDVEAAAARHIPRGTEALRLLTNYLGLVRNDLAPATPELSHLVATHIQDLVAVAIGATRDGAEIAAGRGIRAARLKAIKHDVLANLASHDLTVAAVAKRHGLTPRYIHMLFEGEDVTFSKFVLAERLAHARRMLADPRHTQLTVTAIAYAVGFGDLSHFNHAFRRRYGASPTEIRRENSE